MRKRRLRNAPGIFLIFLLVGLLGYLLGWSKALEIRTIEISAAGNESLVRTIMVPRDLHIGLPIARVSTSRIQDDLAQFTWVRTMKIDRRWLAHDVKVMITERQGVAQYIDSQGVIEYFDASGHNFISPNPPKGVPVINFAVENGESRSAVATFLAQAPADLTANLSSLSVDIRNQISLTTRVANYKSLQIAWGSDAQIPLKVQVLRKLLRLPENEKLVSVDLSNPLTPTVK